MAAWGNWQVHQPSLTNNAIPWAVTYQEVPEPELTMIKMSNRRASKHNSGMFSWRRPSRDKTGLHIKHWWRNHSSAARNRTPPSPTVAREIQLRLGVEYRIRVPRLSLKPFPVAWRSRQIRHALAGFKSINLPLALRVAAMLEI